MKGRVGAQHRTPKRHFNQSQVARKTDMSQEIDSVLDWQPASRASRLFQRLMVTSDTQRQISGREVVPATFELINVVGRA